MNVEDGPRVLGVHCVSLSEEGGGGGSGRSEVFGSDKPWETAAARAKEESAQAALARAPAQFAESHSNGDGKTTCTATGR